MDAGCFSASIGCRYKDESLQHLLLEQVSPMRPTLDPGSITNLVPPRLSSPSRARLKRHLHDAALSSMTVWRSAPKLSVSGAPLSTGSPRYCTIGSMYSRSYFLR